MAQNLPPRGTKKITLGSGKIARKEQAARLAREDKPKSLPNTQVAADNKHDRDYERAVEVNGERLLFDAQKSGFLSLSIPQMRDFTDAKGLFDQQAYKHAVNIWRNNVYDLISACKRAGRNWKFSKDWKDSGVLFVYDENRKRKVA